MQCVPIQLWRLLSLPIAVVPDFFDLLAASTRLTFVSGVFLWRLAV